MKLALSFVLLGFATAILLGEVRITVRGRQTHVAMPWRGVDPIVVGAQIVRALQTIIKDADGQDRRFRGDVDLPTFCGQPAKHHP